MLMLTLSVCVCVFVFHLFLTWCSCILWLIPARNDRPKLGFFRLPMWFSFWEFIFAISYSNSKEFYWMSLDEPFSKITHRFVLFYFIWFFFSFFGWNNPSHSLFISFVFGSGITFFSFCSSSSHSLLSFTHSLTQYFFFIYAELITLSATCIPISIWRMIKCLYMCLAQ